MAAPQGSRSRSPSIFSQAGVPASTHTRNTTWSYFARNEASPSSPGSSTIVDSDPEYPISIEAYVKEKPEGSQARESNTREPPSHRRALWVPKRGVYTPAGPLSDHWFSIIATTIQYEFKNPDLLEEALESPGSGVGVVGLSCRTVGPDGNKPLANLGEAAMLAELRAEGYLRAGDMGGWLSSA